MTFYYNKSKLEQFTQTYIYKYVYIKGVVFNV